MAQDVEPTFFTKPLKRREPYLTGLVHLKDRGFELQIVPPDIPSKALKRGTHQMIKKKSDPQKSIVDKDNADQSASAPTNPLEEMRQSLTKELIDSGLTEVEWEPQTGINRYQAHFVPRRKQSKNPDEN